MSVFNGEGYLKQSIQSILCQTFTDFEFIIIDDCSMDSTIKIINTYKDKRIRLIKNKINIGLSASLNIGIRASRGRYILRADADDISLPERLETQYNFMEKNPKIGILGTGYYAINKYGERKQVYIYPEDDIELRWKLLTGPVFPHPTVMLRKKVLIENDIFYNEKFSATQDYDLWSRLIHYTNGTNLSFPLIEYRHHSKSISESKSVIQEKLRFKVSAKSLTNLTKSRIILTRDAAVFEKVVKYNFKSLSPSDLKHGYEIFFYVLKMFCKHTYNSRASKLKWKSKLLFNFYSQFEKYIRKNFIFEKNEKNMPTIEFLQLRIIQKSLRYMLLFLKPEQTIYYPSGIIVYSIQLMKRLSKFPIRLPVSH